ncbi:MAG: SDR family oxidoreductase [Ruthenibacterium sp.]
MKALLIGGTGIISASVTALAMKTGWEVTLLNRGHSPVPHGARSLVADTNDEAAMQKVLTGESFDVVAQFVAYTAQDVERDMRLFAGRTGQYIFISSASAYQKPVRDYKITESTPLVNPYWQYSRDKIAAEDALMAAHRKSGFPVTIVRPSHTYCARKVPLALHGEKGSWQVLARMLAGKPVIIHGDGASLWTLTDADDFARGFVGLMANPHALGTAVHITADESMTWEQIYGTVANALAVSLNAVHVSSDFLAESGREYDFAGQLLGDKACSVVFDNSKIKHLVPGFQCKVTMAEGIRRAVHYVSRHSECQPADPAFDAWCVRVIAAQNAAQTAFALSAADKK